jgi:hypothetical protein
MKDFIRLALITSFLFSSMSATEGQDIVWGKMLGSDNEEYALNHVTDKDGNIYVSGKTTGVIDGTNAGMNDGFLIKLDGNGNKLWSAQFGSSGDEDIQWSAIDNNANIYITGFTKGSLSGNNKGKEDVFVVKYNKDGKQEWLKQIGTDSTDIAKGIYADNKGFIYVTGSTNGSMGKKNPGKSDGILIKLDEKGNIIKTLQFGTSGDDLANSVTGGTKDDLFICGTTWGDLGGKNAGFIDGFISHLTANLEKTEYFQFGTAGFDIPLVLVSDMYNNIFVGGSTSGSFAGNQAGEGDCFLLNMDPKGSIIWKQQFGTDHHDGVRGIDLDESSKTILVSGIMNLPPEKAFVRFYKTDGSMLWEKFILAPGTTDGTSGKDILFDHNGYFTHLGLSGKDVFGPVIGGHDAYILKGKAAWAPKTGIRKIPKVKH